MSAATRTVTRTGPRVAATFGWDVGGAHVKVALLDGDGRLRDVAQWPCPLWQGLDHLARTVELVFGRWPFAHDADVEHAVTMTGEMVDLFEDRERGVDALVRALAARLRGRLRFYAGERGAAGDGERVGNLAMAERAGAPAPALALAPACAPRAEAAPARWLDAQACRDHWRSVASANWLASASWVATRLPDAVLVDIGSTTTDIVPLERGRVAARGRTDAARLATGELVYHGVVRTPLCGVAHRIEFDGVETGVMNEWFATTADVYRLTGELDEAHDQYPAADNGAKTPAASRARLARMIGRDARDAGDDAWQRLAWSWRALQLRTIAAGLAGVVAAHPRLARAPLVGAGCGRFLVEALAREGARDYVDFGVLAGAPVRCASWAATCAPGVAVALLAAREAVGAPGDYREGNDGGEWRTDAVPAV